MCPDSAVMMENCESERMWTAEPEGRSSGPKESMVSSAPATACNSARLFELIFPRGVLMLRSGFAWDIAGREREVR